MKLQTLLEQSALLFASFVWTTVVLTGIAIFWIYQDVQARWEFVLHAPPDALAQAVDITPTPTGTPTPTPWAGPGPTATPTPTKPPTPTATRVIEPPNILPETFNPDEPTPVPVTVEGMSDEPGLEQPPPEPPTATPTPEVALQPEEDSPVVDISPPVDDSPAPVPPEPVSPEPPPAPVPADSGAAPTRLVIEAIGLDAEVIPVGWHVVEQGGQQYSIWQVADFAVGWHKTSAALGQPGNTVLAGHHNVKGEVFRDLVNLEVGDKVVAYAGGQKFEYTIELKTIVKEKGEPLDVRQRNAQWISPSDDERLTMVTCWPYTNNTHRVIVVAKPN